MAPPGGRAEASRGDQASAQRVLAGGGRGLHRGVHGPARRQHRHRRPAHLATDVPRQRRCGDLGGSELPPGPGGHGGRRRSVRRHVGAQAPLRLRLRDLHRRVGPVWAGPEPGHADRVPGAPGRRGGPAAGQQRGHHRAGGAQGVARQGHRDPRCSPSHRPGPGSHGRRVPAGGRRVAAHLLRQRALRPGRDDRRTAPGPSEPPSPGSCAVRLDRTGLVLPRRGGRVHRHLLRQLEGMDLAFHPRAVRCRDRPGLRIRAPGRPVRRADARSRRCSAGPDSALGSPAACCPTW